MKIIKGAALIAKAILSISNRGAKLDGDIHLAGVSVLAHVTEHGDTTLADKLVQAMPKGSRKLALVEWMLAHGQVSVLDAKAAKETGRVFAIDRAKTYDEAGAIATSWVEFRKEPEVSTAFDAGAAVAAVMKRLTAASKGGKAIEGKSEAIAQAKALLLALEAPAVAAPAALM